MGLLRSTFKNGSYKQTKQEDVSLEMTSVDKLDSGGWGMRRQCRYRLYPIEWIGNMLDIHEGGGVGVF